VEKQPIEEVSKLTNSTDNTSELKPTSMMASVRKIDEYARSEVEMELELMPGESRGYWKYHAPGKWFKQAKAVGKINNEKAALLFDSGAEVSIVDTAFARKVGCVIDESQRQECVGIGESTYMTKGRTRMKVTLAGSLVYYFALGSGIRLDMTRSWAWTSWFRRGSASTWLMELCAFLTKSGSSCLDSASCMARR